MNIIKCGYYSRAALISSSSRKVRLLFEGGYYSGCGYYSSKYGIYIFIYIFITGAAYVVSNSTLHAHAHAHVKLQSAAYSKLVSSPDPTLKRGKGSGDS